MLYRIIGGSGSGKSEYIMSCLGAALKKGKKCFVIVPEQQSVSYEAALCDKFGDSVNMLCEVLNFERLPNRIAREFGGIAVNNIDKGGACALLSVVAESLKPQLSEYSAIAADSDFAQSLLSLISRMKMALVTPEMIKNALEKNDFNGDSRLSRKLKDIMLIYSEYEKHFGEELFDPRDSLTRLGKELPEKPFFKNSVVFIDGYYNFTQQEYAIIKSIIAQSSDTYISFTLDDSRECFDENKKAYIYIGELAKNNWKDIAMPQPHRAKTEALKFIERNIWKSNAPKLKGDDGSVRRIFAKNRFDEVEAAAAQICEFVREGGRYKDITLLAGKTDTYSAIVESVFSRNNIPVYLSAKEELTSKPIFSFIIASLGVVIEDFSLRSMKRYIKSGFSGLSVSESDALLNYASSWNIRGKGWYGDDEWILDPEGYREGDLTERGAKQLEIANKARNKVVPALSALRDTLKSKDLTVSSGLRAIYHHLISMNADEQLRKIAEKDLKRGDREKSDRNIQLWKLLINIIDQLDNVCGEHKTDPKRLLSLIKLMCDCYSLGSIPASADSVTFGSANLIRAGGSKLVIVLGVCDGEFPSSASRGGFFDRDEAVLLEGAELFYVAETLKKQLNESRFFTYAALSAPAEKLVLLCPRSELGGEELRPSSLWHAIGKMLPDVAETEFSQEDMYYSRTSIATKLPSLQESAVKDDIIDILNKTQTKYFLEEPLIRNKDSKISFEKQDLMLSPSKFESYIHCPFSYFGRYLLDLREKKSNEFNSPEMGNFIHKILEQFMAECVSTGEFKCPTDKERKTLIEEFSKKYCLDVFGEEAKQDKRFMHVYGNMVKTIDFVASSLCDEFSESKFVPSGFEFKIGMGKADIPAIEYDVAGKKVRLRGSIDRVDTYEENGVKYVRVIDYKTYDKSFSLDLVANGLDTQLLHYLFAYCEKTGSKPSGALYYIINLPHIKITGKETEEDIKKEIKKSIKRRGILLNDKDIVYAMSPDCSYVPAQKKEGGIYSRSNNLLTAEEFDQMAVTVREQVEKMASNVFCGNMDINPFDAEGKTDPCKNCKLGPLCRSKKNKEEHDDEAHE